MSTIDLTKGGRINLQKTDPGLTRVRVGLGWDANKYSTGSAYDIDVSAFLLKHEADGSAKLIGAPYFVFFNNLKSPNGEVTHMGDNRTGAGDGDDETLVVDVAKTLVVADEVSFVITIHDAVNRKQNFGQITKSYVKLYNDETGAVLAQYALEDDFSTETAVQVGSLFKKDGQMIFKAVGQGFNVGLADFVKGYGGDV